MQPLTPARRRALRSQAHHLDPVVSIGHHGLTPPVLHEIDIALAAHELIKIRVHSDVRDERESMMERVCAELGAAPVQHLGKLLIVFRPAPAPAPVVERRDRPARRGRASGAAPPGKPRERRPQLADVGERHARHRRGMSRETPRAALVAETPPRRRLAKSMTPEPQGFGRAFDRREGKPVPQAGGKSRRRAGGATGAPKSFAAPANDRRRAPSAPKGGGKARQGERRPSGAPRPPGSGAAQRKRGNAAPAAGVAPRARGGRPSGAPKSGSAPATVRRRRRPTGGA